MLLLSSIIEDNPHTIYSCLNPYEDNPWTVSLLSCKSFFQSVYNASTPFNVKNFNVENNNVYSAYTSSNDEEQSIYNAVILFKSFTNDAKLSCTLS